MGSFYEGFPNSILEVLSLGIPVIAFNSPGGHNEIIREDFNGFLCKDKNHYTEMIRYSLEKKWNKESIIYDIKKRYNSNKIMNEYSEILKSL